MPDLEFNEYTGLDLLQLGNTDIVCEWIPPEYQETPPPLIYPLPWDLPFVGK